MKKNRLLCIMLMGLLIFTVIPSFVDAGPLQSFAC